MPEEVGLDGIAIAGFRSFGAEPQYLGDLAKVNMIIGQNNVGKSNILRLCGRLPGLLVNGGAKNLFDPKLDLHVGYAGPIRIQFQIKKDSYTGKIYSFFADTFPDLEKRIPQWSSSIWAPFTVASNGLSLDAALVPSLEKAVSEGYDQYEIAEMVKERLNYTGGSPEQRLTDLAATLKNAKPQVVPVKLIPGQRQVTVGKEDALSGGGLITRLNALKNPAFGADSDEQGYFDICQFASDILGESVVLDIPSTLDQLLVRMNNRRLPLESLGAGVQQVVVLAAMATLETKSLVCIEEPETFLHPHLQRRFIEYLTAHTDNQYMITTHSNAVLDCHGVNVYHCQLVANASRCTFLSSARERGLVLDDLGYKASDILQANCVIWVEGPSDRVLLNHWIRTRDPELVEGLHYSIMFYGGRLLAHLTVADEEVGEFIKLLSINRNSALVIDSDKAGDACAMNDTKIRVVTEGTKSGALIWVTAGREIENYIPEAVLHEAIKAAHANAVPVPWGQYSDVVHRAEGFKSIDKVKVARNVARESVDFSVLDLGARVDEIVAFIQKANLMPQS